MTEHEKLMLARHLERAARSYAYSAELCVTTAERREMVERREDCQAIIARLRKSPVQPPEAERDFIVTHNVRQLSDACTFECYVRAASAREAEAKFKADYPSWNIVLIRERFVRA